MPKPLLSPEEFDAELRRHGLVSVPIDNPNFAVWRNEQTSVFVAILKLKGFIPLQILIETLKNAGIAYDPRGSPN